MPTPPRPDADVAAVRAVARLARFAERALGDLSLAHYRVLSAVSAGDARASRVADRLALGRPAVSVAVEALSRRGLIARATAPHDHRVTSLALTGSGQQVLQAAELDLARRLRDLLGEDADDVMAVLVRVGVALEDDATRRAGRRVPDPPP